MHTTTSNPIARLLAPIGKSTLALLAFAATGTAMGWTDIRWGGGSDATVKYWDDAANWTIGNVQQTTYSDLTGITTDGDWLFEQSADVHFNGLEEIPLDFRIANNAQVTFTGDDNSCGLSYTGNGWCFIGAWTPGSLTIASGSHSVGGDLRIGCCGWVNCNPQGSIAVSGGRVTVAGTLAVGGLVNDAAANTATGTASITDGDIVAASITLGASSTSTGSLNLNGGKVTTSAVVKGDGTGSVSFNGGTLAAAAAGTLIDSGLTVAINAGGGTIATDYDVTVAPAMTGTGSLTKTGAGVLTLSTMPTFSGTITVAADAGSVILPAGATVEAGIYTATRAVENGVEYYANPPTTITQDDIVGDSIVLTEDTILNVTANAVVGNLAVSGPYTLTLTGSAAITATSLNIAAGTTVQLASGTTLADGRIVTTSVTGAGVIGYTGVNPDDSVGYGNSATWTGTVWVQGLTGLVDWNPTAFGNSESTLRLSGVAGYFANGQISLPFAIELENGIYSYGIDLTNGYSFNSNGGWGYVIVPMLKGSGTYKTSGSGGNLFVVTDDWSGFTGNFTLANKTVWLGYGTPTAEVDYTPGTVAGGIRIAEGKSVNWSTSWTLSKFLGEGTIKVANPWDATQAFAGYVGDSALWTGTVELAACVNDTTSPIVVYPERMGNANSTVVFKGLGPKDGNTSDYASYWIDTRTIDTNVRLDGDVTLYGNGYSGEGNPTTIRTLSGEGNFTLLTALSAVTYYDVTLDNYTGTLAAKTGQDCIRVTVPLSGAAPAAGTKLVSVSSEENMGNVSLAALTVDGAAQPVVAAVQNGDDGYGLYVTAVQRDVYWIGGASGNWSDTTAWALADGTPLNAYPQDFTQYAGDNVVFTNVASVAVDVKVVVTKITLDADVTFSCDNLNGGVGLWFDTMDGEGKLLMSNLYIAIISSGSRHVTIMNDIEVVTGTSNVIQTGKSGLTHLYGDITGGGTLTLWTNGNNGGAAFHGDNSGFYGTFDTSASGSTRNDTSLFYGNASSANAIWKVKANSYSVQTVSLIRDSGTYYFGALQGYVNVGDYAPTIVVGDRSDEDSSFNITSRKNTKVVKTGSGVATQSASGAVGNGTFNTIYSHDIYGGTMVLDGIFPTDHISFLGIGATLKTPSYTSGDSTVYPDVSALIKNSSSAICFDDGGEDFTWATALASSNGGGLTKKGAGTLTLTAVPQYSGQTVVEAGELVVPAGTMLESLSGEGKLVVDLTGAPESGILFSLGNKADGATVEVRNAPEGYKTLNTANGVIYYVGNPNTYVWTVSEGSGNWSEVSNWSVDGGTPAVPPTAIDTVQFADGVSVVIDAAATALTIEGNGSLTITADYDLSVAADIAVLGVLTKWGMATVSANGAITAGSVAVGTGAMTTYSGSEPTALTLDSGSTSAYGIDDAASALGYGAKYSVVRPGTLVLSGHGQIVATGDQTVDVATAADTNSFTGFMSGSMSLNKTGAGTLALFGNNTFTGDFAIEQGAVRLNTPLDIPGIRYDFDSSDESWFSYDGSGVLRWQDAAHPDNTSAFAWNNSTNPSFVENDSSIFNGRKVLYSDSFRMIEPATGNSAGNPKTAFFVVQNTDGGHTNIAGDRNNTNGNIKWRNNGFMAGWGTGGSTTWNSNGIWGNGTLATQGDNGGYNPGSSPTVLTFMNDGADIYKCWFDPRTVRQLYFGGSGKQAWAEFLSYTRELSFDEKAAVEQYLMAKWGINNMEYTVLPKTAAVTMAPGTTLDMGGLTQTVASFAGAGTVANGSLKTTGDLVATGSLTIQAVEGQAYTLSTSRGDVVTFTGAATGYFVQPQDGAGAASRFVVPNGVTVGFDRDGDFDVTILNAPVKWTLKADVGAEATTYRIGSYPFQLYLR